MNIDPQHISEEQIPPTNEIHNQPTNEEQKLPAVEEENPPTNKGKTPLMENEQRDEEHVINSDEMEKKIMELYTEHYSIQGTIHPRPAKLTDLAPPQTSTTQNMTEEKYTYHEYLDSNENFNPF